MENTDARGATASEASASRAAPVSAHAVPDSAYAASDALVYGQRLTAIVSSIGDGVTAAVLNEDGTAEPVFVSDRFYELLGHTKQTYFSEVADPFALSCPEDAPIVLREVLSLREPGDTKTLECRVTRRDGVVIWLGVRTTITRFADIDRPVRLSVFTDITQRKEAEDQLRIREEMLRIAADTDERLVVVYEVKANACRVESRMFRLVKLGDRFDNVPESLLQLKVTAPESEQALRELFERIRGGEPRIRVSLRMRVGEHAYRWYECNAATVMDADNHPDQAVLVFHDITEQRGKEAIYKKWQQSIDKRPPESYTLFRCNLLRTDSVDERSGALLKIQFDPEVTDFNERTRLYAEQYVHPDDRDAYSALLSADALLTLFYRGEHAFTMEYREMDALGVFHWRLLTVETVEYPHSKDVQAFLLYEDIDEKKTEELKERELAQTDPLTGVLNRVAFARKMEDILARDPHAQHALLMMDLDGFKQLNDRFGHAAGDQALLDAVAVLRALIRPDDLVCRLGGDEFLVFMRNIPYDAAIEKHARQIIERERKSFSRDVKISASVGIAVTPRDGADFDALYRAADRALYTVKQSGKDSYAFCSAGLGQGMPDEQTPAAPKPAPRLSSIPRRRMLIADGDSQWRARLGNLFRGEYVIETAKNGSEALMRLRFLGSSVSVTLLELNMPGMDGYEVLRRMNGNADLRAIPVIAFAAEPDRDATLMAIELGAADVVSKPVDDDLIRLRVKSAIGRAENEWLRAQNSYLQLQRGEEIKYHTVLESTGIVVVEYNWHNLVFIYDDNISRHIAGRYDGRGLWAVLLSDMVAETQDVKKMQELMMLLANDRERDQASTRVTLKTPSGAAHWFRVTLYKQVNDFGLTDKMIITFVDIHDEMLSNEKLRFQATRDELTGLYNRAGFLERAAEMIAGSEPGAYVLSCLDINRFKVINDQYGTLRGDEVLRQFAETLLQINDGQDTACCRVTGDNFAILFPARLIKTPALSALHRASEKLDGTLPPLKISIGRCVVDDKTLPVSAIYDRASLARETVKGRYDAYIARYDESMRTRLLRQQALTSQMRGALDSGQFEVWFQPQINHATGALFGAEALVRWRHPEEGIISPAEFVPIFEQNGFVFELDKYVWAQACAHLRRWIDQGLHPVPVSVNISRRDILHKELPDVISALVMKHRLPLEMLRLEITESAFSENTEQIIGVVETLVGMGFTVEIDDFGSGYSSLNTLKDVPAQVLKLDMRFLESSRNSQRGGSIIESVARMAKWLGMSLIAEGVETIEQADYLKSIGCEHVQGYLYSRPVPVGEYEKLFAARENETLHVGLTALETWNNNVFWDPVSMESLIFNSYVGGAFIFEVRPDGMEIIRRNAGYDSFFKLYYPSLTGQQSMDALTLMSGESKAVFDRCVRGVTNSPGEGVCELTENAENGLPVCVRVTVRQLARAGERLLFYGAVSDITDLRRAQKAVADTMEKLTTVMNSVEDGIAAMILRDDQIELVMANNRFFQIHGIQRGMFRPRTLTDSVSIIHPDERMDVYTKVKGSVRPGQREHAEYRAAQRTDRTVWVRSSLFVTRFAHIDDPVQVIVYTDITTEKETGERLRFLNEAAHSILEQVDGERAIHGTMERILRYFGGERVYIMEDDPSQGVTSNTYEVCAQGVMSVRNARRRMAIGLSGARSESAVIMRDIAASTCVSEPFRLFLMNLGVRSALIIPLQRDGVFIGAIGIDNPTKEWAYVEHFKALGDYIAILLTRRDLQRRIERGAAQMEALPGLLLDNLPTGAAVYTYDGRALRALHINKRYWQWVEREPVPPAKAHVLDAIHPDDIPVALREIDAAIREDRAACVTLRLRCGASGYKPFRVMADIRPQEGCNYWLYTSYTRMPETARV